MKNRVSEAAPVQVYLGRDDQERLDRLAAQAGTTKSEILRRGLLALERDFLDPSAHPALRLIGIAARESITDGVDAARDHDRVLGANEADSWSGAPGRKPKRRAPKRRGR
jgi:hypothetical protein